MKMKRNKMFGCLLLIGAIAISVGFALPNANADFGETITTAQMASMFGGGYVCPDKDCDTNSGGCPGGNTCESSSISDCYRCKSGNGKVCGNWQQSWGWMCVQRNPESCNDGTLGNCIAGACGPFISHLGSTPDCGTRPDCEL